MERFIQKHAADVIGVLSGFDRMRFRGTLRWLANTKGMRGFLWAAQILLKDFKCYVTSVTDRVRAAAVRLADQTGRRVIYLNSPSQRKEEEARRIAERDRVSEGLICVFTCVERCFSYDVGPNRQTKKLELRGGIKRCLHQYFYFQDSQLGLMHLRLQTWFPFTIHVCLNGRQGLARQMDQAGLAYRRQENCFIDLADPAAAQKLADSQLKTCWKSLFQRLVHLVHPTHTEVFRDYPLQYYWSLEESEWATDVMFRSPQALARLYPRLLRRGIADFSSADVLRFLGRKVPVHGGVNGHFQGEVVSDVKQRPEGLRIKHRVNHNSIKMYDKQGSVLRVETTINNTREMKVFRRAEGVCHGARSWQRLRKGVADLQRRAKISQAANERYLDALADVDHTQPLGEFVEAVCRPVAWNGQRVRALQPWSPEDAALLVAVARPEFLLHGFRNRDLRPLLFGAGQVSQQETRRQSGKVTRKVRMLRAHGLISKISKSHRYQLTARGRTIITALLAARRANTQQLTQLAA